MKRTRVLLGGENPLVQTALNLALPASAFTIVGMATGRCETLRLLTARKPDLVVMSPSVREKTGMRRVREVLAKEHTAVLAIPGHSRDLFSRSLSLLRPTDLCRLIAVIRVLQVLFGQRHFVLN